MELKEHKVKTSVNRGYRTTDVGVIPEDWEVRAVGELAEFANGKPHEEDVNSRGRYCLITLDSVDIRGKLKTEHRRIDFLDNSLQKDDLVIILSDIAHARLLGLCDVIPENGRYVLNQRVGRLRPMLEADPQFLRLQINRRQEHFRSRGQGTSQRHIYRRDIDVLQIPFPNLAEQHAIATALSDVDGLIAGLEGLLAKKRALKQGAMQQLLSGQKRLPGFTGEWGVKRLGDMLTLRHGKPQHAVVKPNGKYPILGTGGIMAWTDEYLYDKPSEMIGRKGTIDLPRYMDTPFWTVDTLFYSEVFPDSDAKFLYYYFWLIDWYRYNESSGVPSMIASTVENIELKVPKTKEEQTAIATLLSDMDAELGALEAKLGKTRLLKQGMMQELLTGRVRLV